MKILNRLFDVVAFCAICLGIAFLYFQWLTT